MRSTSARVLIIGAGGVGQVVAHKCVQAKDVFSDICLASRTESKCRKIAAQLSRPIQTAQVDADNVPELVALIRSVKPDVVINVALPYQDLHIMDACLETGVHYLDTANYEPPDEAHFEYNGGGNFHATVSRARNHGAPSSGFDRA